MNGLIIWISSKKCWTRQPYLKFHFTYPCCPALIEKSVLLHPFFVSFSANIFPWSRNWGIQMSAKLLYTWLTSKCINPIHTILNFVRPAQLYESLICIDQGTWTSTSFCLCAGWSESKEEEIRKWLFSLIPSLPSISSSPPSACLLVFVPPTCASTHFSAVVTDEEEEGLKMLSSKARQRKLKIDLLQPPRSVPHYSAPYRFIPPQLPPSIQIAPLPANVASLAPSPNTILQLLPNRDSHMPLLLMHLLKTAPCLRQTFPLSLIFVPLQNSTCVWKLYGAERVKSNLGFRRECGRESCSDISCYPVPGSFYIARKRKKKKT